MKIQLGGQQANAKPTTSLAEKAKGFQFKKPELVSTPIATPSEKPSAGIQIGRSNNIPIKPSANSLLGKKAEPTPNEIADQPYASANAIPAMSDDKYEVVVGASDSFSEEAGDKFKEQLGILQSAIDGTGDLKDGMFNVLTFLDDNPQYKDNIAPQDIAVFVAACRKVAGITVTEKKTRVTKKKATSALEADIMADLAGLDLQL